MFATTHWSIVLGAAQAESPERSAALERLCAMYWYPLYAYVRRRGYKPEDAQDLTQGFFARMLEKETLARADPGRGRFRTFLLTSAENFLSDQWDKSRRQKRGGGKEILSIETAAAEERYRGEPLDGADPSKLFERRWVAVLLSGVIASLHREYCEAGRGRTFELLKDALTSDGTTGGYAEVGRQLDLSENAVKQTAHRLRRRYRELFREAVAQTVADPGELDDEIRHILATLSE